MAFQIPGYDLLRQLASGSFGAVVVARKLADASLVALKYPHIDQESGTYDVSVIVETALYRHLEQHPHPNILRTSNVIMHYHSDQLSSIPIVELPVLMYDAVVLHNKRSRLGRLIPSSFLQECRLFSTHVSLALAHLHFLGYMHGDVKASNVGWDGCKWVLFDLGLARPLNAATAYCLQTRPYRAPEVLLSTKEQVRNPAAVDMYALGALLHHFLTDKYLVAGMEKSQDDTFEENAVLWCKLQHLLPRFDEDLAEREEKDGIVFEDQKMASGMKTLVKSLMQWDPVNRPSARDCLGHPFLSADQPEGVCPPPQAAVPLVEKIADLGRFLASKALGRAEMEPWLAMACAAFATELITRQPFLTVCARMSSSEVPVDKVMGWRSTLIQACESDLIPALSCQQREARKELPHGIAN